MPRTACLRPYSSFSAVPGTPVLVAVPLAALDLPHKILVWPDPAGSVFVSYNAPRYLADRYQLRDELGTRLYAIDAIADAAASVDS